MSKAKEPTSYREAAAEIDEILQAIEHDAEVDVDELASKVERAASLIRFCSERLKKAEMRVRKVTAELSRDPAVRGEPSERGNGSAAAGRTDDIDDTDEVPF